MKKIFFIQRTYIRDHFPAHHHAGAGNGLHLNGLVWERLMVQEEGAELRAKEPLQFFSGLSKNEPWRWQLAPSASLL